MDAIVRLLAIIFIAIFAFGFFKFLFLPLVIVGLVIFIFHKIKKAMPVTSSLFSGRLTAQSLFTQTTFAVMGHISKVKGKVTEDDISIAQSLMDQLNLDEKNRELAKQAFNFGKSPIFPLKTALEELKAAQSSAPHLLRFFLQVQIQMALADGTLDPKEEKVLKTIANTLGIPPLMYSMIFSRVSASMNFNDFEGAWQDSYYQEQSGYHNYTNNRQSSASQLSNAYKVLGVSETDDKLTVKRAYRKLMNEHHPDKLAAKGLPPEMMKIAKEKAQQIQVAYDVICEHKGWK